MDQGGAVTNQIIKELRQLNNLVNEITSLDFQYI